MTRSRDTATKNQFAKNTYRVLNEPYKLLGILDWRYAFVAAVPTVFFGSLAHSKIAGIVAFAMFAWRAWQIFEYDAQSPLIRWVTLFDKREAGAFTVDPRSK